MKTADPTLADEAVVVLRLAADGRTLRQIATDLRISVRTVQRRCAEAADTLGTNHITHTVATAIRRGLLDEESTDA